MLPELDHRALDALLQLGGGSASILEAIVVSKREAVVYRHQPEVCCSVATSGGARAFAFHEERRLLTLFNAKVPPLRRA